MRVEQEKRGSAHGFPPHYGSSLKTSPLFRELLRSVMLGQTRVASRSQKQRADQTAGLQFDKRPLGTSPSIHILRHVLTGLARHLTIANIGTGAMVPIEVLSIGRSTGTEIDVNMTF